MFHPRLSFFRNPCLVFGLELLSLLAFLEERGPFLAGCSLWIYMGNNNALSAMTRGDSDRDAISVLVARAWELIQRLAILAWFSRAPSKLNPADLPTRDRKLPCRAAASGSLSAMSDLFRLFQGRVIGVAHASLL